MADKKQSKAGEPGSAGEQSGPSLSHRDALTADFGKESLKAATEQGYDGYVWEESKSQYTATEVVNNDQTGPEKTAGTYDTDRALRDHFARADKLDESSKK